MYVANVPPSVDAGPDIEVDEGEVVTLVGTFGDVEFPDTHETTWNFGDNQPTESGVLAETNTPPRAVGTSTVQHAWCDNGVYTVTLRVRDQNGGMATDTRTVTVGNVPPAVDAGPDLFGPRRGVTVIRDAEPTAAVDSPSAGGPAPRRRVRLVGLGLVALAAAGPVWASGLGRGEDMRGDHAVGIAPEVAAKLDPALRQALSSLNFDPSVALPVVIALAGPDTSGAPAPAPRPSREERARQARQREAAFAGDVAGLVRELTAHGATDIQPSWLDRTVGARVTLPAIEAAADRPETRQILLAVRRRITA